MAELPAWHYVKPTKEGRTQHLMLAKVFQADVPVLRDALAQLGAVSVEANPAKTCIFATFQDIAAASEAMKDLQGYLLPSGHKPLVRYAEAKPVKVPTSNAPPPAFTSAEQCNIPGLALYLDFISPEEEAELLHVLDQHPWEELARRRVQHYGFVFSYLLRGVDRSQPTTPFPPAFHPIVDKIQQLPDITQTLDQCTVNEYAPGTGLSPHVDTHSSFADFLGSLSIAGSCVMSFRRDGQQRNLFLPPRSLLVMAGESRLAWEHAIPQRKIDMVATTDQGVVERPRAARRLSFTFRAIREGPCACPYPSMCDSQNGGAPPTRMAETLLRQDGQQQQEVGDPGSPVPDGAPPAMETHHVGAVYDAIAPHFSATRFAIWPKVKQFIDSIPPGGIVADVGCGNGKYFGVRRDIFVAGSDMSIGLAEVASKRLLPHVGSPAALADVLHADGLHLPYRSGSCDALLCIAVLHHMSSPERRVQLLQELGRLLRQGARGIVTVWATQQENMKKVSKWKPIEGGSADYLVPWHLPLHRAEALQAAKCAPEVDNAKNTLVFNRYYHLFEQAEIDGLVGQVPDLRLVESFYDKDNWCVVIEKK